MESACGILQSQSHRQKHPTKRGGEWKKEKRQASKDFDKKHHSTQLSTQHHHKKGVEPKKEGEQENKGKRGSCEATKLTQARVRMPGRPAAKYTI